ncbi:MAG: SDR family NAD(P)-dependent oxidoreductase [Acidimicrobiales bacterium]
MTVAGVVDALLEAPVVTSFTNIGYGVRRRLGHWQGLDAYDLTGQVIVVTGATSGLGRAAAEHVARCGATVVVVGRQSARNQVVVDEIAASTKNAAISQIAADLGEPDEVRALAATLLADHDRLDVLVHNAGALARKRTESSSGIESTVASQVVGPFLLTTLLVDRLAAGETGRVITMSSGGMYAAPLSVSQLQMTAEKYNGTEQYARAKRAQVTLNEMWAERYPAANIRFHAMHPGWADTPGVDASLPTFSKIMGPFLRTPAQGVDTLVWLAADDEALSTNGCFWLDRRQRSLHKVFTTRRSDTPARRERLWDWVAEVAR